MSEKVARKFRAIIRADVDGSVKSHAANSR